MKQALPGLNAEFEAQSAGFEKTSFAKHMKHASFQLLGGFAYGAGADDQDKIRMLRHFVGMLPDNFLHNPAHPVADDRIADFFAGRDAEPERLRLRLPGPINDKLTVGKGLSAAVRPRKILTPSQAPFSLHCSPTPPIMLPSMKCHTSLIARKASQYKKKTTPGGLFPHA